MFKETIITEREPTMTERALGAISIEFQQLNRTLDNLITSSAFKKADEEKLLNVFKEILKQNQTLVENYKNQTEQLIGLLGVINKKLLKLAPSNEVLENGN